MRKGKVVPHASWHRQPQASLHREVNEATRGPGGAEFLGLQQERLFSSFWLILAVCPLSLVLSLISHGCAVTWGRQWGRGLHWGWKRKGEQIPTSP